MKSDWKGNNMKPIAGYDDNIVINKKEYEQQQSEIKRLLEETASLGNAILNLQAENKNLSDTLEMFWMKSGSHQCFTDWLEDAK